ncbi:YlxR family protein [Serinicoccus kebangsaanensis]|uniref:YlxR family protein n=1 Tax=Serinicoccus kebangsaanensis TaxID=2602069 RepID=UPI001EE30F73|nr:YlxR family protein [Serinicoccus kebangsaanensis]
MGCRNRADQSALLRFVARQDRADSSWRIVLDERRRLPGRGAYVHPDPGCMELAVARRAFARALRLGAPGAIDVSEVREWRPRQQG